MNRFSRARVGILAGVLVLSFGFILLLNAGFWRKTYPNGITATPYREEFELLAHLLMYSGAVLSVSSTVLWIYASQKAQIEPSTTPSRRGE